MKTRKYTFRLLKKETKLCGCGSYFSDDTFVTTRKYKWNAFEEPMHLPLCKADTLKYLGLFSNTKRFTVEVSNAPIKNSVELSSFYTYSRCVMILKLKAKRRTSQHFYPRIANYLHRTFDLNSRSTLYVKVLEAQ
jgi:hypothetical protein